MLPDAFHQVTVQELLAVLLQPKIDMLVKIEDTTQNQIVLATNSVKADV